MKYNPKAVLFDLDGILLDTEKIYTQCWIEAAYFFGYDMKKEQAYNLRSLDNTLAEEYMQKLFHSKNCYQKIREKRRELMEDVIFRKGICAKKGAKEFVDYLQGIHKKMCIVTASGKERTSRYLSLADLQSSLFDIISVDDVKRGKPFADIYKYACDYLNMKPEECMVLEDSVNGIKSAVSAGCLTIMIPDLTPPDKELMKIISGCYERLDKLIDIVI